MLLFFVYYSSNQYVLSLFIKQKNKKTHFFLVYKTEQIYQTYILGFYKTEENKTVTYFFLFIKNKTNTSSTSL